MFKNWLFNNLNLLSEYPKELTSESIQTQILEWRLTAESITGSGFISRVLNSCFVVGSLALRSEEYNFHPPFLQPLDFESRAEYQLTVRAENEVPLSTKAPYVRTSTATVTIRVLNENEAPRFYANPIEVSLPESTEPGTVLISRIAHDAENSKLRYERFVTKHMPIISLSRYNHEVILKVLR